LRAGVDWRLWREYPANPERLPQLSAQEHDSATAVIERLRDAGNRHDLDAFVACFA